MEGLVRLVNGNDTILEDADKVWKWTALGWTVWEGAWPPDGQKEIEQPEIDEEIIGKPPKQRKQPGNKGRE